MIRGTHKIKIKILSKQLAGTLQMVCSPRRVAEKVQKRVVITNSNGGRPLPCRSK
jgi:hypothetical protein